MPIDIKRYTFPDALVNKTAIVCLCTDRAIKHCVLLAVMANVNDQVRQLKCDTGYRYEYQGHL